MQLNERKLINAFKASYFASSFLFFTIITNHCVFSQSITRSTIGTQGSSVSNDGMSLQQTVGQPALVNNVNVEQTGLRQGFHQPITFIEEQNDLNVNLYPNPNQGDFSFIVNEASDASISYQLFDQQGKLLFQNTALTNELTPVSIQNPSPGMYHLKVTSGLKTSSFKINVIQ